MTPRSLSHMFLLFLIREHPASVIAPLNHTCYKWWGSECCWRRVGWQAVSSALRTPPSAQPSEGRKLACFISPSTIDFSSPLCTSATARTELPDSLKFMHSLWATTRHTWRTARTLTFIYDYSHFHMVRVMLLSVSMQETCNSLFLRNLIACNYVAHFVRVKDHYHDKKCLLVHQLHTWCFLLHGLSLSPSLEQTRILPPWKQTAVAQLAACFAGCLMK